MISDDQMKRAEAEFAHDAATRLSMARDAERALEFYTYKSPRREYSPQFREQLWKEFQEADYQAESRAWIIQLIRKAMSEVATA